MIAPRVLKPKTQKLNPKTMKSQTPKTCLIRVSLNPNFLGFSKTLNPKDSLGEGFADLANVGFSASHTLNPPGAGRSGCCQAFSREGRNIPRRFWGAP